jgi:hypothetical protein
MTTDDKYPVEKIVESSPLVPVMFLLTGFIIAFFFVIGYTQPFAQTDPESACNTSIYNERCNASLFCQDKMNTNFQCQAHCSKSENFFDEICIRATCSTGSAFASTSACRCVNLITYEREDYETCQRIMCQEGGCVARNTLYEITNQLYPSQLLAMDPMKTNVLGYFNGDPSSASFVNTGAPYNDGAFVCTNIDQYEKLINQKVVPGDENYPLWLFKESIKYPFHFWIIWAPYQRFVLSGDTKTLKIRSIRNYQYQKDVNEDNENGLYYEDLFQVEVVKNMGFEGLICHIKNKYGYLTNYDFKLTNDIFTGSDNQRWVLNAKPLVNAKTIYSSENVETFTDYNPDPANKKRRMMVENFNKETGGTLTGQVTLEKNNPGVRVINENRGESESFYWGQKETDNPTEYGQVKVFNANFITRINDNSYRIIDGEGKKDHKDYSVSNNMFLYKNDTSNITDKKYSVQVTPNLDWTVQDNPSFAIRARDNNALFMGRPCKTGSNNDKLCWTSIDRAYKARYKST